MIAFPYKPSTKESETEDLEFEASLNCIATPISHQTNSNVPIL